MTTPPGSLAASDPAASGQTPPAPSAGGGPGRAPSQQHQALVSLLRALSDKSRLRILLLLSAGERSVGDICESLGLPQPTASHHLTLLRLDGMIVSRRDGKQVFYALSDSSTVGSDPSQLLRLIAGNVMVGISHRAG